MNETAILSNEILKGIMVDAIVGRQSCVDADTCLTPGIWRINSTTLNHPRYTTSTDNPWYCYGAMIVGKIGGVTLQIIFYRGGMMVWRIHWDKWFGWYGQQFTSTSITT